MVPCLHQGNITPKGSYGYGENRDVFRKSVQKPYLPVLVVKLPSLEGGTCIGPRTESCVKWSGPIAMLPGLHQGYIYTKRKIRVWRDQKCIPLVCRITTLTCSVCQTTSSRVRRYRAKKGKLCKLGWNNRHGTAFAPRQYLYQKEATSKIWRDQKCIPLVGAKIPLTCAGRQTTLSRLMRYRVKAESCVNWG